MGEGIFPKDKVPSLPVHPNCMCRLVPVFKGSSRLKSEIPKDRILDGGMEYIKSLSKSHRTSLLGENGAKNVDKGGDWRKYIKGFFSKIMTCRIPHDIIQESKITKAFKDAGVSCDFSARLLGRLIQMLQTEPTKIGFLSMDRKTHESFLLNVMQICVVGALMC